jgi:hypothetical protein
VGCERVTAEGKIIGLYIVIYEGQLKSSRNSLASHEFVPPGQRATGHFYLQIFQRLGGGMAGTVVSATR